jgi:DMSO/TMAO reductase YedYZ molybdopterin-dependent catalytic subunit
MLRIINNKGKICKDNIHIGGWLKGMRMENRKVGYLQGVYLGGVSALAITGLTLLGKKAFGLPFLPFDLFDWMTRHLPGGVIGSGIDGMVQAIRVLHLGPTAATAKTIENGLAVLQFLVLGALVGLVVTWIARRWPVHTKMTAFLSGALAGVGAYALELSLGFSSAGALFTLVWIAFLAFGWGWVFYRWFEPRGTELREPEEKPGREMNRRQFLTWFGGSSLVVALGAFGISRIPSGGASSSAGAQAAAAATVPPLDTSGPAASPSLSALAARIEPAPGTRAELTPMNEFYRIDINSIPPAQDAASWRLKLDGLVDQPLTLSLDELRSMPAVTQVATIACISNEVGGDLIGNTEWTGVPLKTVLERAHLQAGGAYLNIQAFDGFYESLSLQEALDGRTLLVYAMGGQPLSAGHGFPLRIYIPNHYGMKQPKWIEHIEISDKENIGYWVERGWSTTAIPQTMSVIDTVAKDNIDPQKQLVPVGGIAWAGARGISKVEVQMDKGAWMQAQLRTPPLSPLTWVQWRADLPASTGRHVFTVRATDTGGALQDATVRGTLPDGATGLNSYSVDL